MKKSLISFLVFILLGLGILYGLNKQQKSLQPEEHEVVVRLVLVDVIAVDKKGDFATDLTKDDFEIYEDGKRIPIDSLELISLKKPEFEVPEIEEIKATDVPGRKKRFFVIFDSINTIKRMLDRSKARIIEKLVSLVKLGEEIMILELDDKKGMNILQDFTSDEELIAQAVNKASGNIWIEKSSDTLSTPSILLRPDSGRFQRSDTAVSRFQEFSRYAYQFETRIRFEKTINSLLTLLNMIKDYPGRKPVLYISGGMPALSFEELYKTKNLGEVWSNCIKDYHATFEASISKADYKTMLEFSMFGDPTLNAEDGDDPKIRSYDYQRTTIFERLIDRLQLFEKLLSILKYQFVY